ncbi:hypothetical protein MKY84_00455 [Chryseomicrobium sp. FSL W7-1435]|uniref:hypothetical protein n=1 Tax=Chryseomicrobium sp. FSL W7-1435 TaxID=2921704 RepID=UPI00315A1068
MFEKDKREDEHEKRKIRELEDKKLKLSSNDVDPDKNEDTEVVDPQPRINTENL